MRYFVIDTNCLLRMISRYSPYYPIWKAFQREEFAICVTNDIIQEYQEIISRVANKFVGENVVRLILESPNCLLFDTYYMFGLITQDPDDNKFVDCAIIANADYLVSDDSHFNVLHSIPFPKVNVITLDDFLADVLATGNPTSH